MKLRRSTANERYVLVYAKERVPEREEWSRRGVVRVVELLMRVCLLHLLPLVSSLHRPTDSFLSLL